MLKCFKQLLKIKIGNNNFLFFRITASALYPDTRGVRRVKCKPDTSVGTGRACLVSYKNGLPYTCVVACAWCAFNKIILLSKCWNKGQELIHA